MTQDRQHKTLAVPTGRRSALAVLVITMAGLACGRVPEPRLDAAATPLDMSMDRGSPPEPTPDGGRESPPAAEPSVEAPDAPIDRPEFDAPDPLPDAPPAIDGTLDTPAEMDAPWTPLALDGLVLWLDAATGVTTTTGERVMRWADQSSHGHHALQNIARARPVLLPGNTGHPWVMFGMDDQLDIFMRISDTEALQWGIGDFAIWIVGRSTNTFPDYGTFIRKNMASAPFTGWLVGSGNPMSGSLFFQLRYSDVSLSTNVPPAYNTDQPVLIGVSEWLVHGHGDSRGLECRQRVSRHFHRRAR
jgi:hypothetical protein